MVGFENLTPSVKAGEDMSRFCYNAFFEILYRQYHGGINRTNIELIDEHKTREIMEREKWLDQTSHLEVGMQKFAKTLECDLLLLGTVGEYNYKRGLGEDPVVSLHLRLFDVHDNTVIWSGSHSRVGRFSWFKEDALGRLGHQVSKELIKRCFNELSDQAR